MSLLPFWTLNVSVPLLSMEGQKALGFYHKYPHLCSEDDWRSYGFGTTWGWVINDRTFIFGWTKPLTRQFNVLTVRLKLRSQVYGHHFQRVSTWNRIVQKACQYQVYITKILSKFVSETWFSCIWLLTRLKTYHTSRRGQVHRQRIDQQSSSREMQMVKTGMVVLFNQLYILFPLN